MNRPTFDGIWMNLALSLAARSTCSRLHVGCVIVSYDDRRVIALGYNGSYSGGPNGCDSTEPGNCGCLHAEDNACIKMDYDSSGRKMYTTTAPCLMCAKRIINAKIHKVIYLYGYRKTEGIDLLKKAGIKVSQLAPGDLLFGQDPKAGTVRFDVRTDPVQGSGSFSVGPEVDPKPQDQDPVQDGET